MSVPEMVLRILARFPKLLVAIVKRCSSTTLHLLQDIFSFRNASVLRSRERKHFAKGNIENNSPLTTPSNDREKDAEVKVGSSVRSTTILCSSDNGSGPGNRIHTTNTSGGVAPHAFLQTSAQKCDVLTVLVDRFTLHAVRWSSESALLACSVPTWLDERLYLRHLGSYSATFPLTKLSLHLTPPLSPTTCGPLKKDPVASSSLFLPACSWSFSCSTCSPSTSLPL
ncbi:hypothetical protein EV401DRAFT_1366624 [Pisolithus croceorrhizus]|nr:hypothetical protein EV401DRAFT_1366624 [Pisolithus croceorrhizus]